MNAYSRLSSKGRTVIPKVIRERLELKPGDTIRYKLDGNAVRIEHAASDTTEPFAVFGEWFGAADETAFGKL